MAEKKIARSERVNDLIEAAIEIEEQDAKAAGKLGYVARALIQATMPHKKVEGNEFTRSNGIMRLTMLAPSKIGLPYGSIPRLLVAWMSTEAVITKSPVLSLGRSQTEFVQRLGFNNSGGARGDINRLKDQTKRLLNSFISLSAERGHESSLKNVLIADDALLLWNPKEPDQQGLWDSTLTLSAKFFEEVTQHPVPVDMRALDRLSRSPLAMDIYCWLIYRLGYLSQNTLIPWHSLKMQFGASYADSKQGLLDFKREFKKRLGDALLFYPSAKVVPEDDGLSIYPSAKCISAKEATKQIGQLRKAVENKS